MSKQRMINTKIWNDTWVSTLDPLEKLLFVYFISNEHTNLSGIYEVPLKIAAIETGIDTSMFEKMFPRLQPKVFFESGWVILPNFPKHQNMENPKIGAGIQRELELVPEKVYQKAIGYGYPIHRVSHLTKLNLTKPSVRVSAQSIEVRETLDSDLERELGDSKSPRISGDKLKAYNELIAWSEQERGFLFPKTTKLKQYRAFKLANENGITRDQLIERWEDMASDKFWQKAGFDWMNVLQEIFKKPA